MAGTLNGTCLCEGIKFQVQGEPEAIFTCYCTHCSKNAGAPGQISAKYRSSDVTVLEGLDRTSTYILNDTSSGVEKHKVFCGTCGCTLWTIPMKHKGDNLIVRTSLLENGLSVLKPRTELFKERKLE